MSLTVGEIFDEYVDSLANLPSEIDQNMQELRSMDEDFQRQRETYAKHKRNYLKTLRSNINNPTSPDQGTSPTTPTPSAESRTRLTNEYKAALQMQDHKVELAMRMYDLISRHIERIDLQMAQNNISIGVTDGSRKQNRSTSPSMTRVLESTSTSPSPSLQRPPSTLDFKKGPLWEDWPGDGHRKRSLLHGTMGPRKRTHHSTRTDPSISTGALVEQEIDPNEPRYCYCNQVSFGDMVACDGDNCDKEWFHYACVGLTEPPAGKWFCNGCSVEEQYHRRIKRRDM